MEFLSASDAKRTFGDVLLKAQKSPVKINKNGKPVAVVLSATDYEELEAIRKQLLKIEIKEGIADLDAGDVSHGQEVLSRLRKRTI